MSPAHGPLCTRARARLSQSNKLVTVVILNKKQDFVAATSSTSPVTEGRHQSVTVVTVDPKARQSPVQGEFGQVKIRPGTILGGRSHCAPERADEKIQVKFATEEMVMIAKMHLAVVVMFDVIQRLPGERRGAVRSQLGALVAPEAGDDDEPAFRRRPPSAADISLMEATFNVVIAYWRIDEIGAKLVVGRAVKAPWKRLMAEDPLGRTRAMLNFVRNNTLYRMARSADGQKVIGLLDKLALDKLDRKAE